MGDPRAALPDAQAQAIALAGGDVDVNALGKERIGLDHWAEPFEIDGFGIVDEEDDMRVADIDGERGLKILPADRHRARVHRISERDLVPIETWNAHVDAGAGAVRDARDDASQRLDPLHAAFQQGHAPRGVAAGLHLAAVGIEDPHAKVRDFGRLDQDELVAADAGAPIGNRPGKGSIQRDRLFAPVDHDEIVAEAVHLVKAAHHRRAV